MTNYNYDEIVRMPAARVHKAFTMLCEGKPDSEIEKILYPEAEKRKAREAEAQSELEKEQKAAAEKFVREKGAMRTAVAEESRRVVGRFM